MAAMLIWAPNYYIHANSERRLLGFYRLFSPFQEIISKPNTVFLTREFSFELCSFIRKEEACQPLSYHDEAFFSEMPADMPLETFLAQKNVDLFYADEIFLAKFQKDPRAESLLTHPEAVGWKLLSLQNSQRYNGLLFKRLYNTPLSFLDNIKTNRFKHSGIFVDGWVTKKSSFELNQTAQSSQLIVTGIIPAIKRPKFKSRLQIKIDGQEVANQELSMGKFNLQIKILGQERLRSVSLQFSKSQVLPAPDQRRVAAQLKFIGFTE
ncbi:MAG: hypothetical protein HC772_01130 [Leptolyngbyaceae cyanobacterium CRU_2_3]|nr:hypothetical protein [Leptolyngbyaceae cyanobacterium CRU_2_3]